MSLFLIRKLFQDGARLVQLQPFLVFLFFFVPHGDFSDPRVPNAQARPAELREGRRRNKRRGEPGFRRPPVLVVGGGSDCAGNGW
jgi:hypothetical protein